MPNMNREQMIEWLIDNDMDYINTAGGMEWVRTILGSGFGGYENETDEELQAEILERDQDAFNEEKENV